jgi:hypothetical protein
MAKRRLSEVLDQQFSENSNLSCGLPPWRPDDENAPFRRKTSRHHVDQCSGSQMVLGEKIRKRGNAEPRYRRSGEGGAVIRFEPPLRMDCNRLVPIDKSPDFRSLHERLMRKELVERLWSSVLFYIVWAGDESSKDRPDAARD